MLTKPQFPVEVFYDGSCSVCATEIEHYLRQDQRGKLLAVDISAADFNPEPYGIALDEFMYQLHVIDRKGEIYQGVEAFWAIWQAFPSSAIYGIMGAVISMPLVTPFARLLYKGFARIRPYLPKKHVCDSGTCKINRKG